ncbi:MAG TPA: hypothetical protein VGO46_19280 [Gemmatimonadaceae bacterium]|jgi:hypothetical protein|nr:hypothetical protein [Gemmatimonadaceae bacterium]
MMTSDKHDEGARDDGRDNTSPSMYSALRALAEHGVDVTGSESGTDLAAMQSAVDAFRRAAETLAGRTPHTGADDLCRQVVPPRAADETPRQYVERVNRMTERFRTLSQSSTRDRPR